MAHKRFLFIVCLSLLTLFSIDRAKARTYYDPVGFISITRGETINIIYTHQPDDGYIISLAELPQVNNESVVSVEENWYIRREDNLYYNMDVTGLADGFAVITFDILIQNVNDPEDFEMITKEVIISVFDSGDGASFEESFSISSNQEESSVEIQKSDAIKED